MSAARPPFRADHVGSLLRPAELKAARERVERGEMSREALREVEDRLIRAAVARQEAIGLESITDGEYRRGWWNHDFLGRIDGVEIVVDPRSVKFVGTDDPRYTAQVRRKVRRAQPMLRLVLGHLEVANRASPHDDHARRGPIVRLRRHANRIEYSLEIPVR